MATKFKTGELKLPPVAVLRERYEYNHITGRLYWKRDGNGAGVKAGDVVSPRPNGKGYLHVKINGHSFKQSRVIWKMVTGRDPGKIMVEHEDEDQLNNAWHNLRLGNRSQNGFNVGTTAGNTSGYKGVVIDKSRKTDPWRARVSNGPIKIHIGYYPTAEEAYLNWCRIAYVLHGSFFNPGGPLPQGF